MASDLVRADSFHTRTARKETFHTLSLVEPHLRPDDVVLDVGCGPAYVAGNLAARHSGSVLAVDIVDCRRVQIPQFKLYDGITLPFADGSCDVVLLSFMLHHVPNETKPAVIEEVRRVTRRTVIALEDTPRNAIDRYFNHRHGETFRKSIGSTAAFGFYTQREWEIAFRHHHFAVKASTSIGRFTRDLLQPFARSCIVVDKLEARRH